MRESSRNCGCGPGACAPPAVDRRRFLQLGAALAAAPPFAGPFSAQDAGGHLVPADKKLAPEWLRSLFERGAATEYRGAALARIGLPIGGIGCGQLYLAGDGRLWLWDVFNLPCAEDFRSSAGPHYAQPLAAASPIAQGFELRTGDQTRALHEFRDLRFRGQYPFGIVDYADPDTPLAITLRAFSPFVPLHADDSSLPATIFEFTLHNTGAAPVEGELVGWLQNAVCLASAREGGLLRRNLVQAGAGLTFLSCEAVEQPVPAGPVRAPLPLEDFERGDYTGWTVTGTAFGAAPLRQEQLPGYQGDVNAQGTYLVNSHNTRQGEDVAAGDAHTGTLTSRPFRIERHYLSFRIGGGAHAGRTGLNVLVDGAVVASAVGRNHNRMELRDLDLRPWAGRSAQVQIVDAEAGSWGNVGVDDLVLTDTPREPRPPLAERPDYGTMGLALFGAASAAWADFPADAAAEAAVKPAAHPLTGALAAAFRLAPQARTTLRFAVVWHFPTPWRASLEFLDDAPRLRRHYAARFADAAAVARHLAGELDRLTQQTSLWHRAWYEDSTLPWWFLERTFANASTLATSTCYRFDDGRFYGWEGTYCCPGTCTHVWQYAQAVARLFPELERDLRERVDYGLAFHADSGAIDYRGEAARSVAHDGQAGVVLRAYREHQMSADRAFLERNWAKIKRSLEHLIACDRDGDGLWEGAQYNTLDASWYGKIAWLSSLYLAALRAGEAMALEMIDDAFAERCRSLAERGSRNLDRELFDGEYYIHLVDPQHPEANNTNRGCHIDQVFGQSWAHQVGLPRVVPREHAVSALRALWRYNFAPDVGRYRDGMKDIQGGRWYAMPGEAGLLMCTFPKGGAAEATGKGGEAWAASYFNECMTGFEYQVAAHMLWDGLTTEGLAIARAIHDRYRAERRNPWNEVECSDHYARAMASHGVYLAACGFEYHGPKGHIGFAPRLNPAAFRGAFTAAEGWGSYRQEYAPGAFHAELRLLHGRLRLATLAVQLPEGLAPRTLRARHGGGEELPIDHRQDGTRLVLSFRRPLTLEPDANLEILASA